MLIPQENAPIDMTLNYTNLTKQKSVTVNFPFNTGATGQIATADAEFSKYFSASEVTVGSSLEYDTSGGHPKTFSGKTFTTIKVNVAKETVARDGNAINFWMTLKEGYVFVPTQISFEAVKYGTDGGKIDVSFVSNDGSQVAMIANSLELPATARYDGSHDGSPLKITETIDEMFCEGKSGLRLNLYNLDNAKQYGFSDIVITGNVYKKEGKTMTLATTCTFEAGKNHQVNITFQENHRVEIE